MKKFINIFLAVLITLFSFPINSLSVNAEGKVYDVNFVIKHETNDADSIANAYFDNESGKLIEKNNKTYLQITVTQWQFVEWLKYDGKEVEVVEKSKIDDNTVAVIQLEVTGDLSNEIPLKMLIDVPKVYNEEHDARLVIDVDSLEDTTPEKEGPEEPEKPEEGNGSDEDEIEKPEEPEKPEYEPAGDERVVGSLVLESDADEVYELDYGTDSRATSGQLENPVKLLIKSDKEYIQIPVKEGGAKYFRSLKFNGEEVIWNSIDEGPYTVQYELKDGIDSKIDVSMIIDTGKMVMPHGQEYGKDPINLWFDTETLKMTKVKDKRVIGEILSEGEADSVQLYDYDTDSTATAGQLQNPVKLLVKGDKKYVQIPVNPGGAQYFKSLKFNGEEVIWNSITEAPYIIQYELEDEIDSKVDVSMIIDTGRMIMPHDGINLWLDNTVSLIELDKETQIKENDRLVIDESGNSLKTPEDLPKDVSLTIKSDKENVNKYGNTQGLELAGEVYEFTFENLEDEFGNFELVMNYNPDDFPVAKYEVDIYYFNTDKKEWEPQRANVNDRTGTLTLEVDHFSTYGVFAIEKTEEKSDELTVSEINYEVKHETEDKSSSANAFFKKPGYILTQDGEMYFQTYITNWEMIDWLKYEGKDVEVINVESGSKGKTAFIQMKIDSDLSEEIGLNMHITVPGMYEMEHNARLVFEVNSAKPINSEGFAIYEGKGSGGQGGTPPTPTPGKPGEGKGEVDDKKPKKEKTDKVKADKVSTIDYVVYQAERDEVSAADAFFKKPATLLEKDGKQYLQFTVTSWSMVNWLQANGKDVLVISEDKGKDTATVQIEINGNLSDYITLGMKITVPGLYEMEHDARLALDPSSIVELEGEDAEGYFIHTGVAKPEDFGTNGDKKDEKKQVGENGNPQTGDTSQIFFFATLLMASLAVLVLQIRRRLTA